MTTPGIDLVTHVRGDTFVRLTTLGNGWVAADFTGGLKFTLRERVPASSVVTDADVVDQASLAGGEITASGAELTITIPASRTNVWPTRKLYWDLQGVVSGAVPRVYTIASGTVEIVGDVTRST
jgi:hypothetical protein